MLLMLFGAPAATDTGAAAVIVAQYGKLTRLFRLSILKRGSGRFPLLLLPLLLSVPIATIVAVAHIAAVVVAVSARPSTAKDTPDTTDIATSIPLVDAVTAAAAVFVAVCDDDGGWWWMVSRFRC